MANSIPLLLQELLKDHPEEFHHDITQVFICTAGAILSSVVENLNEAADYEDFRERLLALIHDSDTLAETHGLTASTLN